MTPAEKLARAKAKAETATRVLCNEAVAYARLGGKGHEDLLAAAKTATNAWHEVGRAEKAVRDGR